MMLRMCAFFACLSVAADCALVATGTRVGILPAQIEWVYWIMAASTVYVGTQILIWGTER